MKAFTKYKYGGPEILNMEDIKKPILQEKQILVQVMANSANPADWHTLRGKPYFARFAFGLFKPKDRILGADFAGLVVEIGPNVSEFKPGDRVFGELIDGGAFAEYVCAPVNVCARIPDSKDFREMAGLPIAGLTALQALTTHGKLEKGESVLINGASGGVGHLTVQIAKAYGAQVTGICSHKNIEFVQSLGADQVIPYDRQDIHKQNTQYDLVIDTHGNLTFDDFKRMGKRGILIGFTTLKHLARLLLQSSLSSFSLKQFTAKARTRDLDSLANLIKEDKIKVNIEKIYPYQKIPEAIGYIEKMRTKGKVVMVWKDL